MERPRRSPTRLVPWALAALLVAAAAPAFGQAESAPASIRMEITVVGVSNAPGDVDPRARRVDRVLRGQVAYESLSVLGSHQRAVAVDEIWRVKLPTKDELRVRPLDVGRQGALLSVDWDGVVQGDFRVRPGRPLIFGGPRYGDGKLVVVLDTR